MSAGSAPVQRRPRPDVAALIVLGGCAVLLAGGGSVFHSFLTPAYLLQQLQIASFLGILAAGARLVILLGQIDLSVPWTLTGAAIITTTLAGMPDPAARLLAMPAGLAFGAAVGLVNGVVVARLRIPSMVWTLAMNAMLLGGAVFWTGGHKPRGRAPDLTTALALGRTLHVPNAFLTWLAVSAAIVFLLRRTIFGRYLYAIGNNERAVLLAGARVERVMLAADTSDKGHKASATMMVNYLYDPAKIDAYHEDYAGEGKRNAAAELRRGQARGWKLVGGGA